MHLRRHSIFSCILSSLVCLIMILDVHFPKLLLPELDRPCWTESLPTRINITVLIALVGLYPWLVGRQLGIVGLMFVWVGRILGILLILGLLSVTTVAMWTLLHK